VFELESLKIKTKEERSRMKRVLLSTITLSLLITQSLRAQVILQDSFSYANGLTTFVSSNAFSSGLWTNYSGANDSTINNGRLEVFGSRAADIWRPFTNTPATTIYASFIVNATNTVNNTNYFAHFSQNLSTFNARTFAVGNAGGTPNTWRLGITAAAGAGSAVQIFPQDLATNVNYQVVISYDTVNRLGTLWVEPTDAADPKTLTTDTTSASTPTFFSFRQPGTTVSMPNMRVDELYVGNSFADVSVGAVKPPVIFYQPPAGPTTNFAGGNFTLSCVAGGSGALTFQWQHEGTNLVDDVNNVGTTSNRLSLVSAVISQSGAYKCIVTSTTNSVFAGSVTSIVAQVVIIDAPVPPTFITQPVSQTVYKGQNATFTTTVIGPASGDPITYTWYSNNVVVTTGQVDGDHTSSLVLNNATIDFSATYKVAVTNTYGGRVSTNAVLTVINPPIVSIAYLRSLIDPVTFAATNVPATLPYQVTGTVTSFTNTTTGDTSSYYLQDATAGINIFATLGGTFRPQQGDVVTYVGVLSTFTATTGGLELFADTVNRTYTSYSIVSSGNPLPTPRIIPFAVTNTYGYLYVNTNLLGSLVTLTNVYFGARGGTTISTTANDAVAVADVSGQPFTLQFYSLDLDTAGQTLPSFATSVTGVLIGSHPNIFLAVTKFSDIVLPPPPPIPLDMSFSGGVLTFNWTDPSFNLQSATNVAGPYTTIPGATTGFTTNTTSDQMYFRLFHP
jgi:hypothetical protein